MRGKYTLKLIIIGTAVRNLIVNVFFPHPLLTSNEFKRHLGILQEGLT